MDTRRLVLGLWLRMAVASLLWAGALVLVLAAVFVLASVLSYMILLLGWLFGGALLLCVAVPGIGYLGLIWILSLSLGSAELSDIVACEGAERSDAVPDIRSRSLDNPPTVWQAGHAVGRFCAIPAGLVVLSSLALLVFDLFSLDPVWPALGGGAVTVLGVIGWVGYDERRSAGVRARLKAEYDIISEPERKQEIQRRVRRLAEQANGPVPEIEIGASQLPRAATVGYRSRDAVMLVSRGLVDRLDDRELDAVLAHELAHLRNRDVALMTALAAPRSKLAALVDQLFERDSDVDLLIIPLVLVCAPVYLVSGPVVPMVARYREYVADDAAGELTGHAAMASALDTLDRAYSTRDTQDRQGNWLTAAFGVVAPPWEEQQSLNRLRRALHRRVLGTHPPTASRVERLRSGNW